MVWLGFYPFLFSAGLLGVSLLAGGVVLLLALWLDRRFGEPPVAIHPVVWMGNYLKACGSVTVRCPPALAFTLGALAWWTAVLVLGALAWGLQAGVLGLVVQAVQALRAGASLTADFALILFAQALAGLALLAWLLKTMLAWRMLREEASAVEAALQRSLEAGRERLSWLVSRDTAQLTSSQVRESAIETLAENLNDSVVAPIFWFVLLGLPGAVIYRFANTADAMWGYRGTYKGQYWEWAGKWTAWADDALSWLPARLTAALLTLAAGSVAFEALRREARKTPSPNSGWPMAAMALALGVSLGKPGVYTLNPGGRAPGQPDMQLAQQQAAKVVRMLVAASSIGLLAVAFGAT
jgi:adenosylcobinamide-phosphate synthase